MRGVNELVDAERATRTTELRALSDKIDELTGLAAKAEASDALLAQLQDAIQAEKADREKLRSELRTWVDVEAKTREEADISLARSMQTAGEALEESLDEALQK